MKGEIWKDVRNYEGKYQISNMGRVKSLNYNKTGKEKILKGRTVGTGYLQVGLWKEGKCNWYYVHRLVATAFCNNPEGYKEVNHKNEDKTDNRAENLEWCSHSYNNRYNDKSKKVGKKLSKPVFSVDRETGLIMFWESAMEAERCTGINNGNINLCCQGKKKSAGNHIWFFADDDDNE